MVTHNASVTSALYSATFDNCYYTPMACTHTKGKGICLVQHARWHAANGESMMPSTQLQRNCSIAALLFLECREDMLAVVRILQHVLDRHELLHKLNPFFAFAVLQHSLYNIVAILIVKHLE